jgi:hypothetical protein
MSISLYECGNARVAKDGKSMFCRKSNFVPLPISLLAEGHDLELTTCDKCTDFDKIGEPVKAKDRGWLGFIPKRSHHKKK